MDILSLSISHRHLWLLEVNSPLGTRYRSPPISLTPKTGVVLSVITPDVDDATPNADQWFYGSQCCYRCAEAHSWHGRTLYLCSISYKFSQVGAGILVPLIFFVNIYLVFLLDSFLPPEAFCAVFCRSVALRLSSFVHDANQCPNPLHLAH